MMRFLFRSLFRLLLLGALMFLGTLVWIVFDGLNDRVAPADVAVVLGMAIRADRTPGTVLRERLDRVVELYRAHEIHLIVVSGATHLNGYDEAVSMARYLEQQGVPAGRIMEDHLGENTHATAEDLAALMRARGLKTAMVITHYYHITRTKLALRQAGVEVVAQAHAGVVNLHNLTVIVREGLAFWYYLIKYSLPGAVAEARLEAEAAAHRASREYHGN